MSVRPHARTALDFHWSVLCYQIAGIVLVITLLLAARADEGWMRYVVLIGVGLWAFAAVASATAAIKTYHGQPWTY